MRFHNLCLSVAAVGVFAAGLVLGQRSGEPGRSRRTPRTTQPARRSGESAAVLPGELARVAEVLQLDEAQQKMIADSIDAQKSVQKDWQDKNLPRLKELEEQYQKLYEERRKLSHEQERLQESWRKSVSEVLTRDQTTTWAKYNLKRSAMSYYWGVKFTPEQDKKIEAILDEAARKVLAMTEEQRTASEYEMARELRKAIGSLVTPEQLKQREVEGFATYLLQYFRRAELTEEQTAKVKAFAEQEAAEYAKMRARIDQLTNELQELQKKSGSGARYKEAADKVTQTVLTPEQRAKLGANRGE